MENKMILTYFIGKWGFNRTMYVLATGFAGFGIGSFLGILTMCNVPKELEEEEELFEKENE